MSEEKAENKEFYFDQISVERDGFVLEWEYIDEGFSGDYDPEDPDDRQLLRFTIYKILENGTNEQMDDASYCTLVEINTDRELLKSMGEMILQRFLDDYPNYKHSMEEMSWITPVWLSH
jgi:hypothetical protein